VSVQGYSQKLPVLLDMLIDQLAAFRVKPERFAVMAEAAQREYANVAFQQVYQWAMYRAEVGDPPGAGGGGDWYRQTHCSQQEWQCLLG
jgi:hypothetical protein